jgi:SnoaL-like polyketide cyclase
MTGIHRGAWAGLTPRGARMDIRLVCVFDFEDTQLVNETVFFDFATLQRQLGPLSVRPRTAPVVGLACACRRHSAHASGSCCRFLPPPDDQGIAAPTNPC